MLGEQLRPSVEARCQGWVKSHGSRRVAGPCPSGNVSPDGGSAVRDGLPDTVETNTTCSSRPSAASRPSRPGGGNRRRPRPPPEAANPIADPFSVVVVSVLLVVTPPPGLSPLPKRSCRGICPRSLLPRPFPTMSMAVINRPGSFVPEPGERPAIVAARRGAWPREVECHSPR